MGPPSHREEKSGEHAKLKETHRKTNKPLIEKRRRARINECLLQLKAIVLDADDSKNSRASKLEKADILEMTVEFVKEKLPKQQSSTEQYVTGTPHNQQDYFAGYTKCLSEITRFLEQGIAGDTSLRTNIVNHVTAKIQQQLTSTSINSDENDTLRHSKVLENVDTPVTINRPNIQSDLDMPVDLRTHGTSCDNEKQDNEKNEKLDDKSNHKRMSRSPQSSEGNGIVNNECHLTSTLAPIGYLCGGGGQAFLLVQPVQSVTSQPVTPQFIPPIAHQQMPPSSISRKQVPGTTNFNQTQKECQCTENLQTSFCGYTSNTSTAGEILNHSVSGEANVQFVNLILPTGTGGQYIYNTVAGNHRRPW